MTDYALLAVAGVIAGIMNAIAGGGTFVTFPALVFTGVPSVIANASNAIALFPAAFASAWAYRRDFQHVENVPFKAMMAVSLTGALIGAVLLLYTPDKTFDVIVPWLLLAATVIFTFGPRITPHLRKLFQIGPVALLSIQFLIGIYGGYFGGAMGIVMLALYGLFGLTNLNAMNAAKSILGGAINGITIVVFAAGGKVWWPQALVVMAGALLGGYFGAHYARRMNPQHLRAMIIAISVTVTIVFFVRA